MEETIKTISARDSVVNVFKGDPTATFPADHGTTLREVNFYLMDGEIIRFFTEDLEKQEEGN